jgi:hypothetical protein
MLAAVVGNTRASPPNDMNSALMRGPLKILKIALTITYYPGIEVQRGFGKRITLLPITVLREQRPKGFVVSTLEQLQDRPVWRLQPEN